MTAMKLTFKDASGAIAMSGFTVVLALFALIAAKYGAYHRFAVPFSLSIFIMGIASMTLVPAMLSIFGRASFFPFIPRTEAMEQARAAKRGKTYHKPDPSKGFGLKIGKLVTRKPWHVVITCILVLGILASFSTQVKYSYDLLSSFPEDMPSREGFELISDAFTPGELAPITVVADTKGSSADLADKLAAVKDVDHVQAAQASVNDPNLVSYSVILRINPYSREAMSTIPKLRDAAVKTLEEAGIEEADQNVWIGGQTAEQYDTKALADRDASIIMPLIIILITCFGSLTCGPL